jgi:RNA polymerase-binding protein DksA
MTIDPKLLAELKEALLKEKGDLEENLGRIAKPTDVNHGNYAATFEDIGTDRDDNTTEVEEYTDNLPVEFTLEKKLQDVIEALQKIENGTYGICTNCNQEIPIERLRVNPSAKTCIHCK